jgi:hypothetical protein
MVGEYRCGACKKAHTDTQWRNLELVGIQYIGDGQKPDKLELRNCKCGSTLSRWLEDENE